MNKQTELALKMAIEALSQDEGWFEPEAAIKACKEALAQPAQEPVATVAIINGQVEVHWLNQPTDKTLLYTHPAPSWQGLSDDEIVEFACEYGLGTDMPKSEEYPLGILWYDGEHMDFARAIEAKLKEKNHGD